MVTRCLVKPRTYRDSVELMSLSTALRSAPGIRQAVAIMGTERNKSALAAGGLRVEEAGAARPDDLLIVIQGDDASSVEGALARAEQLLAQQRPPRGGPGLGGRPAPRSVEAACRAQPGATLALISVPGPYAAAEAYRALRCGLHVHLFSNGVSLEDEVRLKQLGRERGLLVMGPDCGTSLLGGVPLGFANAVARGPIGIVGAAGTGIQEVSVLIDRLGSGISHAIGTGGRDLTDEVGGVTTLMGLDLLEEDPGTQVIVIVSKPPGPRTAEAVQQRVRRCRKPVVVAFLGMAAPDGEKAGVVAAETLEQAAARAVALAGGRRPESVSGAFDRGDLGRLVEQEASRKRPGQRYLRGLYSGGTLAYEALHVLTPYLGPLFSNAPLHPDRKLPTGMASGDHCIIDLGEEEFTRGRPHPMIDPSYRADRLVAEAADPEVAVILCDVVLGFGAHPDPGGALARAVQAARERAQGPLTVVASVCGTPADPQDARRQEAILREAGVLVFPCNAYAAEVAGAIAARCAGKEAA